MQLTASQIRHIGTMQAKSLAGQWERSVELALPPGQRDIPLARLTALSDEMVNSLDSPPSPLTPLLAVDVRQTTVWLGTALQAGIPYRETRAAALLQASAALGALWFVDDRLLQTEQMLPLRSTLEETLNQLLAGHQGARFKLAADRAQRLHAGLRSELMRFLSDKSMGMSLRPLAEAAFAVDVEENGVQPEDEENNPSHLAIERFMARERSLLAQSGIQDPRVSYLCIAGDLTFGLGRCARLLASGGGTHNEDERLERLRRQIHVLAEFVN